MKLPSRIEPGLVLKYSYLWADEAESGHEEGRKDRPAVVVLKREIVRGSFVLTVAPITHSPPRDGKRSVQVDHIIKERLGLDDQSSWVITDELNVFVWPGPDLRPLGDGYGNRAESCFFGYIRTVFFRRSLQAFSKTARRTHFVL